MSDPRQPARERYDALVDLMMDENVARHAYALVKITYAVIDGRCEITEPLPLLHDFRAPDCDPPMPPGTDFWPLKRQPEVAVLGQAYAPEGRPAAGVTVAVSVGEREKRVAVFGDRAVTWLETGRVRFEAPQPFTEMPLTWNRAYGGLDWRAALPEPLASGDQIRLATDHPGMYPRNPWGRGYVTEPGEVPDFLLPNLEDPSDLLTPERLITGDPRDWWRQPLPWSLGWVPSAVFPRFVYFGLGVDAWYPAPADADLPEVARGLLRPDWRTYYPQGPAPHPRLRQEASHGLTLDFDPLGAPVELVGLHPDRTDLAFALPQARPTLEFDLAGRKQRCDPRLHHVVFLPDRELVTLTYGAVVDLPRTYVPGIHKHIPVAVSVAGDEPLVYEPPPPVREVLAAALARHEKEEA